ncbi:MAG: hypothetical protein HY363_00120 [Candidatus Aenigmarchaeota archaeon]|nr:hypothetical protein [Candidatus Aenigmarchaeota archaeon]
MYEELKHEMYTCIFKPSEFVAQDAIHLQASGAGRLDMLTNYFPNKQDPVNIRRVRYGIGILMDGIFRVRLKAILAPDQKIAFMNHNRQFCPYIRGLIDETLEISSKKRKTYDRFYESLGKEFFTWYKAHQEQQGKRLGLVEDENGHIFVKRLESLV